MSCLPDYNSKRIPMDNLISWLRPNDRILCYGGAATFLAYLDEHYAQLDNVELYTMFLLTREYKFLTRETAGHIRHYATFVSASVREAMKAGDAPEIILTHYSDTDDFVRYRARPTVLLVEVTPMDEDGCFTMGFNSLGHKAAAEMADRVIVQVNRNMPRIYGECNKLHISQVSAIVEQDAVLYAKPSVQTFDDTDMQAASFVAERIPNGATLQIGVGRVPDAVGKLLGNHHHLGVHTEMFSQSLMTLMNAGVIDNSAKTLLPGKSVFSFAGGARATQEIYDFMDGNQSVEMYPISWVNDPRVIAQCENFVSINSALAVDLTGQVCSETIGLRTFSGPGGQLDFVRGARWAKGGKSFIIINSVTERNDGSRISKISCALPAGSAVTTPRADVDSIVTEYGVAELRFKSLEERARAMISIAHPDFREELTFQAKKAGYFI
jgi:4-hydroxybutyrate CoA-transferase